MNWQVYHGKVGHTHGGHGGSSSDRSGEGNRTIVPIKAYNCTVGSDGGQRSAKEGAWNWQNCGGREIHARRCRPGSN